MRSPIYLLLVLLLSSCATLFGGKYNTLVIGNKAPFDALILLDGSELGSGPGKYRVKKCEIQEGSKLEVVHGFDTLGTFTLTRRAHPAYVAADLILLGFGIFVDAPTGNIYRPYPRKFMLEP